MTEQLATPFGRETSADAIKAFTNSGEKAEQQAKVLAFMQRWPYQSMTAREIGLATGVSAHKRLPELAALGQVERVTNDEGVVEKRTCTVSGVSVMTWRLAKPTGTFQAADDLP